MGATVTQASLFDEPEAPLAYTPPTAEQLKKLCKSPAEKRRLRQLETLRRKHGGEWGFLATLAEKGFSGARIAKAARALIRVRYAAWVLAPVTAEQLEAEAAGMVRGSIVCCLHVWEQCRPEIVQLFFPDPEVP